MLPVILAFAVGVAVGLMYARWRAEQNVVSAPTAPGAVAPNKRAKKAGLTEADFVPSDDILERLRRAEAGELDPAELAAGTEPPPRGPAVEAPAVAPLDPEALTDAERRVLERLRRMAAEGSTED